MALSILQSPLFHSHNPQFRKQVLQTSIHSVVTKETLTLSPPSSISGHSSVLLLTCKSISNNNIPSSTSSTSLCSRASSISPPDSGGGGDDSLPPTRIFIKGLPKSTSEGTLRTVFSRYGKVTRVKVMIDSTTRDSLGFAYISLADEESAQLAIKEMNGTFFQGRFIYVTVAKPGTPKQRAKDNPYKF